MPHVILFPNPLPAIPLIILRNQNTRAKSSQALGTNLLFPVPVFIFHFRFCLCADHPVIVVLAGGPAGGLLVVSTEVLSR